MMVQPVHDGDGRSDVPPSIARAGALLVGVEAIVLAGVCTWSAFAGQGLPILGWHFGPRVLDGVLWVLVLGPALVSSLWFVSFLLLWWVERWAARLPRRDRLTPTVRLLVHGVDLTLPVELSPEAPSERRAA